VEQTVLAMVELQGGLEAVQLLGALDNDGWVIDAQQRLASERLLPGAATWWLRGALTAAVALTLFLVAAHKLELAHLRGRHNTGLLEILRLVLPLVSAFVVLGPRRTRTGDRVVADLQTLFATAREEAPQLAPGQTSRELALLTAVFGIAAVPTSFAFAAQLFPRASADGSSGSGCGSSCGSSCGGGCGGGCGGCGGG
jgi:uncharacterized protein (TIGR04222 family)